MLFALLLSFTALQSAEVVCSPSCTRVYHLCTVWLRSWPITLRQFQHCVVGLVGDFPTVCGTQLYVSLLLWEAIFKPFNEACRLSHLLAVLPPSSQEWPSRHQPDLVGRPTRHLQTTTVSCDSPQRSRLGLPRRIVTVCPQWRHQSRREHRLQKEVIRRSSPNLIGETCQPKRFPGSSAEKIIDAIMTRITLFKIMANYLKYEKKSFLRSWDPIVCVCVCVFMFFCGDNGCMGIYCQNMSVNIKLPCLVDKMMDFCAVKTVFCRVLWSMKWSNSPTG